MALTTKTIFVLSSLLTVSPLLRGQYTIKQWNVENGLPQSSIKCIEQTHDGYLWIGTWNGLARFDGVHMTVFNALNTPGFNPSINCIHEDRNHELWIGTDGGGLYRYREDSLVRVDDASFRNASIISAMNEDSAGRMWFGTDTGIFVYAKNRFLHFHYTNPFPFLSLTEIVPLPDGSVYLQFVNEVFHIRLSGDSLLVLNKPFRSGGYRIDIDSTGSLWYGVRGKGLVQRDGIHERVDQRFANVDPEEVFAPRNQEKWVITPHGPYVLKQNRVEHLQSVDGIDLSNIEYVFEDREGILWLGVAGAGLLRLLPKQVQTFTTVNGLETDEVMCGMEDRSDNVWVGAWLGGLARTKANSPGHFTRIAPFTNGMTVMAVCQSRDGTIWIGTWGHGVYTIRNGVVKRFRGNGLADNTTIYGIVADTARGVWIVGLYGAVWQCDGDDVRLWNSHNGLTDREANSIIIRRNGDVWIGTEGGGIAQFSKDRISFLNKNNGLIDDFAHVATEDKEGAVWLTSKIGLQRWKNGVLSSVTAKQGFDDTPSQCIQDNSGDYWIGGTHGIHRIRGADLNGAAEGKLATLTYLTIGKSDGMPVEECSGGSNQHVWKTRDGDLWFSTTHGAVRIDPRRVGSNPVPPGVVIEQVQVEHQPVPLATDIVLHPGQTKIEFDYTGISFAAPDQIRFDYKLVGFDKDWRDVGNERYAQYTNLEPGKYAFRVKAANNAGIWNETGASIDVLVLPPFYATWWFRGVAVLLFLTVGPAVYAFRVRQLKGEKERQAQFSRSLMQTQEAERQRIANELHDSLGQNLLVIKNRLLMAEQERGGKNELAEMSDLVSKTIEEVRSISHNLRPHQLDQLGISKTIRALAKQVGESSGIALTADVDGIDGLLSGDEEISFFRIVQESCNNLVKHSRASSAGLSVKQTDGSIEFALGDNGRGMDVRAEQSRDALGRGFGLSGIQERARTYGWALEINSLVNHGTTIRLTIPLRTNGERS
jgi:signal transduction histidine kinase/ligand-binding sensor domain-containing protein